MTQSEAVRERSAAPPKDTRKRASLRRSMVNAIERQAVRGVTDRPVFLGGCPRSGTTMLRTMLHSHPDLAIPRETHFVLEAYWRRREWGDLRQAANRERLVTWLVDGYRQTRFRRLELDRDEAFARLMAAPPTIGSIVGTSFILYSERHGASRWGDKRPLHIQQLPIVYALFPDVQFVNIVRDPRAVIASMRKLGWLDTWYDGTVVGGIDRWLASVRAGQRALRRYRPDQYLELRYEELLADPRAQLQRVCDFTGLADSAIDQMLDFHLTNAEIPTAQAEKYHPLLGQPLTKTAVSSWTDKLPEDELALIESVAAKEMQLYGYEPVMEGKPPSKELAKRWRSWQRSPKRRASRARSRSVRPTRYPVAARLTAAQRRRARFGALNWFTTR